MQAIGRHRGVPHCLRLLLLATAACSPPDPMFASGGARASFARDATVRSNATTLMLEATVENGVLFAGPSNPAAQARQAFPEVRERGATTDGPPPGDEKHGDAVRLRPWAERLSRSTDARGFRKHCGDSFVSAIYSGAQLLSTIQFREKDATKRDQIKAAIQASYGPTEMSADASKARTEALNKTDLTIQFLQLGGGGGTIPTSREDLRKKLNGLTAEANAAPRFHAMEVTAYTSLADWPDAVALPARAQEVDAVVADFRIRSSTCAAACSSPWRPERGPACLSRLSSRLATLSSPGTSWTSRT